MHDKELHLEQIRKEREKSLSQKRDENRQRESEKRGNVKKILKEQDKERMRTLERLEQKGRFIMALQQEKNSNKWQIEKQRIVEAFEKMKSTGKLNFKTLSQMGVTLPDKKAIKENLKNRRARSVLGDSLNNSDTRSQRHFNQTMASTNASRPIENSKPVAKITPKTHRDSVPDSESSAKSSFKTQPKPVSTTNSHPKPVVHSKPSHHSKPKPQITPYERSNNPPKSKPSQTPKNQGKAHLASNVAAPSTSKVSPRPSAYATQQVKAKEMPQSTKNQSPSTGMPWVFQ